MTTTVVTGVLDRGRVHRSGDRLIVEPPTDASVPGRRALEQELILHVEATTDEDERMTVPVQLAHRLSEILDRPWPAGRWSWEWSQAAEIATVRAAELQSAFLRVLSSEEPSRREIAEVEALLQSGGFSRTLLSAQEAAVTNLVRAEGGGNFSVPGSGKTTMTYAVYVALRERCLIDRMLVVAPQSAYEAWMGESVDCFVSGRQPHVELAPRSPRRSTEVVVVNYERAAQSATRAAIHGWAQGRRVLVVYDEAHRAKRGARGEHGRGALDLADMATRRLVLTGTPMPNGIDDLEAILELAWPGHGRELASPATPGAEKSWVRVNKDELGLEPAEVSVVPVRLDENHSRVYDAVATGLLEKADELLSSPALASRATARLIAAASNPTLLLDADERDLLWGEFSSDEVSMVDLLRDLTDSVRPAKLLAAAAMAHEHSARGEKLLVWTNFLGNVRELGRLLRPLDPAIITGAVALEDPSAATDRRRELTKFRENPDCSVLIATPQTLGEGVSLHHACQSQVHIDRTFNAGLFLQSLDRTHRVGMPPGTKAKISFLVATDTIDEAVHASLDRKLLAMEDKLRDPTLRRLTEPDTCDRTIGKDELTALLRHLR